MTNEKSTSIEQDISFWLERENKLKGLFRNDIVNEKHFLNEKLRYFTSLQNKHQGTVSEGEKILLNVLKGDIKKLEKQLYPSPVARFLIRVERAVRGILEERKAMKEHGYTKTPPLTFNQKKIDNNQKMSADGGRETLKNGATHQIKPKEIQSPNLNSGPLKQSVPSRNTISARPLRNTNAENNNDSSKLKEENSPKKQLRHRLR